MSVTRQGRVMVLGLPHTGASHPAADVTRYRLFGTPLDGGAHTKPSPAWKPGTLGIYRGRGRQPEGNNAMDRAGPGSSMGTGGRSPGSTPALGPVTGVNVIGVLAGIVRGGPFGLLSIGRSVQFGAPQPSTTLEVAAPAPTALDPVTGLPQVTSSPGDWTAQVSLPGMTYGDSPQPDPSSQAQSSEHSQGTGLDVNPGPGADGGPSTGGGAGDLGGDFGGDFGGDR